GADDVGGDDGVGANGVRAAPPATQAVPSAATAISVGFPPRPTARPSVMVATSTGMTVSVPKSATSAVALPVVASPIGGTMPTASGSVPALTAGPGCMV